MRIVRNYFAGGLREAGIIPGTSRYTKRETTPSYPETQSRSSFS